MSKSIIFLVKSFLGNFYRHLAIFFWSHWVCNERTFPKADIRLRKLTFCTPSVFYRKKCNSHAAASAATTASVADTEVYTINISCPTEAGRREGGGDQLRLAHRDRQFAVAQSCNLYELPPSNWKYVVPFVSL